MEEAEVEEEEQEVMVLKEVKGQENKEEIVQEEKVQPEVQVM